MTEHERRKCAGCVFCDKAPDDSPMYALEPLNPVVAGHMLFIPSNHYTDAGTDPDITGLVFRAAAKYGSSMMKPFNLITSAGTEATQSVMHLHVHYVPRVEGDGLHLPWTGQSSNAAQDTSIAPDAVE